MDFSGFVLVVGAGSGIGLETALLFAERGARGVAFADKNFDAAKNASEKSLRLANSQGYRTFAIEVDVVDRASVAAMVKVVVEKFGRIDCAVNSAGINSGAPGNVECASDEKMNSLRDVNCMGILHCLQEEILVMRNQEHAYSEGRSGRRSVGPGSIINVTSLLGMIGYPSLVTYVASKFAARGVIKVAALENRSTGLRINEVCPAFCNTPMFQASVERAPEVGEMIKQQVPLGRVAEVEEVAGTIYFLATPAASYINGQSIVIDAGATVGVVG